MPLPQAITEMVTYSAQLAAKQKLLYSRYGGMMTLSAVSRELGYKNRAVAQEWVLRHRIPEVQIGAVTRYESDVVARAIVDSRRYPEKKEGAN